MKTLLQLHSHAVTLASNADQALRDARLEMPDVFLVDIGLPGKSGHKLTTELGQLPCKKPLRIIAMTGFGQPEDRRRSLAAGFDDHMVKPVTLNALLKCLGGGANPMK